MADALLVDDILQRYRARLLAYLFEFVLQLLEGHDLGIDMHELLLNQLSDI